MENYLAPRKTSLCASMSICFIRCSYKADISVLRVQNKAVICPRLSPVARIIWLLVLAFSLTGCDTKIGIELVTSNNDRPTFRVTGDEAISWVWVHGPYSPDPTSREQPVLWRIIPKSPRPLPRDIPPISYGIVPPGWAQTTPEGVAPSLVDGGLYGVTVVTVRNRSAGFLFTVQDGKAVVYRGNSGRK